MAEITLENICIKNIVDIEQKFCYYKSNKKNIRLKTMFL